MDRVVARRGTRSRLHFRLPLDPARLLRARQRIRDYLHEHGVAGDVIDAVVLSVEEAMTNAVRHSGAVADLEVHMGFEGGDLHATVEDKGAGFDVARFDRTRLPDPLAPGGRGLYLIAQLSDDMRLRRDGGVEVSMLWRGATSETVSFPVPRRASSTDGCSATPATRRAPALPHRGARRGFRRARLGVPLHLRQPTALQLLPLPARGRRQAHLGPLPPARRYGPRARRARGHGARHAAILEYHSTTVGRGLEAASTPRRRERASSSATSRSASAKRTSTTSS